VRTCSSCGEANSDRARFCQACASPLAPAASPAEVRKVVTVLFCDVTGSTALAERLDPESIRRAMSRYFEEMRVIIERHGGTVEKFIGDAVMAVFGIPKIHEDDALRAIRAASEMRDAMSGLNEELEQDREIALMCRIGVNTGEVIAGDLSAGQAFVTGDVVNVASRLEGAAAAGDILVGEETYRLVERSVEADTPRALALKGKSEPVLAYRLLSVTPVTHDAATELRSPLVGREQELETIRKAWNEAGGDKACRLVTVLGNAGEGKSRLVDEFANPLEGSSLALHGRCLPYGEGITYWPGAEVVRQAAGIADTDRADEVRRKLALALEADERGDLVVERLLQVLGTSEQAATPAEIAWAMRRLLEILAAGRPVAVVFEDLHWAESTFLDVIEHIADWSTGAAILLLCTARQEFLEIRPRWSERPNAIWVRLHPLDHSSCSELIGNLLGDGDLAEEVRDRIGEAAGGNALFLEQMVSMLVDDGSIRREAGRWVGGGLQRVTVPPTITALLAARLDRLDPEERLVIEAAAVAGKVFQPSAVRRLVPGAIQPGVDGYLMSLARKELIRPERSTMSGEDAFCFQHILIRDAAYEAIPKERRAVLHEGFAGWAEATTGGRPDELEEILGYHLEQAYRCRADVGRVGGRERALARRAAERLRSAGRRALERADIPAAENLLARGEALFLDDEPAAVDLLLDLTMARYKVGNVIGAEQTAAQALEQARRLGDPRLIAHALVGSWTSVWLKEESIADATRDSEWAMKVFEEAGDELGLARAWALRGVIGWARGLVGVEEIACERGLGHAQTAGDLIQVRMFVDAVSRDLARGPTSVENGIRRCHELVAMYPDDVAVAALMAHPLAHLKARIGEFAEARELATRYRDFFRETGQRLEFATSSEVLADVEMIAGHVEAGVTALREGCAEVERVTGNRDRSWLAVFLGRALLRIGRLDEAERVLLDVNEAEGWSQALKEGALSRILARHGRVDEARQLSSRAVRRLAHTDFLIDRADVFMDEADVCGVTEDAGASAHALEEALLLYEQKGDDVSGARVRAMLRAS
jgi:class 3 adenylate cyclase/tetratricopeptide (TPR) repeat protein